MQEIRINLFGPDGQKTVSWTQKGKKLREVIAVSNQDPGEIGRASCRERV